MNKIQFIFFITMSLIISKWAVAESRFGDLTGSIFIWFGKIMWFGISIMPILAMPFAALFSLIGFKISKHKKFRDL